MRNRSAYPPARAHGHISRPGSQPGRLLRSPSAHEREGEQRGGSEVDGRLHRHPGSDIVDKDAAAAVEPGKAVDPVVSPGAAGQLAELVAQAFQTTLCAGELTGGGQLHAGVLQQQALLLDAPLERADRLPKAAMP